MPRAILLTTVGATLLACGALSAVVAQPAAAPPPIEAESIAEGIYVLSGGRGANSTLLVTSAGALLVDSKLDESVGEALRARIATLTDAPLRYLINSHVHPDHTGGNAVFGSRGVQIIGHEEVRRILAAGQRGGPPAPSSALPTVTFANEEGLEVALGGEIVRVLHMPAAHTTDNSAIQFVNANVFHLGDLYGSARYPVLAGGTLGGFIEAIERVLSLANERSRFVPGVGPVTGRAELAHYLQMLQTVESRVRDAVRAGQSLDELVTSSPTAEFDATFGAPDHPRFLPIVYEQISAEE